jgi:hypothetical protein
MCFRCWMRSSTGSRPANFRVEFLRLRHAITVEPADWVITQSPQECVKLDALYASYFSALAFASIERVASNPAQSMFSIQRTTFESSEKAKTEAVQSPRLGYRMRIL